MKFGMVGLLAALAAVPGAPPVPPPRDPGDPRPSLGSSPGRSYSRATSATPKGPPRSAESQVKLEKAEAKRRRKAEKRKWKRNGNG